MLLVTGSVPAAEAAGIAALAPVLLATGACIIQVFSDLCLQLSHAVITASQHVHNVCS